MRQRFTKFNTLNFTDYNLTTLGSSKKFYERAKITIASDKVSVAIIIPKFETSLSLLLKSPKVPLDL